MSLEFSRVTRAHPCPVCGKPDYCEIGDYAVLCMRVESDHPNPKSAGGWYHRFEDKGYTRPARLPKKSPQPGIDAAAILRGWSNGVPIEDIADEITCLAGRLGVSPQSLIDLKATWSEFHQAWGFPMRNGHGEDIGIRLRADDGRKWAVKGSRSGLFYGDCDGCYQSDFVLITEGPTDTAAAITLGFFAVGKPCCNACNDTIIEFLGLAKPKRAVIVSDVDSMAQKGIGFIEAQKLQKMMPIKSVIWAPQAKDIRKFLNLGGTRQMIENDLRSLLWR